MTNHFMVSISPRNPEKHNKNKPIKAYKKKIETIMVFIKATLVNIAKTLRNAHKNSTQKDMSQYCLISDFNLLMKCTFLLQGSILDLLTSKI